MWQATSDGVEFATDDGLTNQRGDAAEVLSMTSEAVQTVEKIEEEVRGTNRQAETATTHTTWIGGDDVRRERVRAQEGAVSMEQ